MDPRIRRADGDVQIGTDDTIFSMLEEVGHAGERLRAVAVSASYPQSSTVVGDRGTVRYSTDDGVTWLTPASPPVAENLLGVGYSCDEKSPYLVAAGDAGRILRSTSGGETWEAVDSPTQASLHDVGIVHPDIAVIVGDGGVILRSTDRGVMWDSLASGTSEDLRAVSFEECFLQREANYPISGLAVGDHGTVLVTRDSGASWTRVDLGIDGDLLQVEMSVGRIAVPWKISGMMLDSRRLWRWQNEGAAAELVRDFGEPVYWFGGNLEVFGEGVLHNYRSPKQCAKD